MQKEKHCQSEMRYSDEDEVAPQELRNPSPTSLNDTKQSEADVNLDDADANNVESFGDGAEFEHGNDGLWRQPGDVPAHA